MRIRFDRLKILAKHLVSRKRGLKRFDFSGVCEATPPKFTIKGNKITAIPGCGTAGCAIGELPFAFPDEWEYSWMRELNLEDAKIQVSHDGKIRVGQNYAPASSYFPERRDTGIADWDQVRVFFGLTEDETGHLFLPGEQKTGLYGGKNLGDSASPKQVADNILAFCRKMSK